MRRTTCAAAIAAAVLTATALSAQAPGQAGRAVAIGCLSQQQAGGRTQYVLTDTRNNPPAMFVLDGDPKDIEWHVGHQLEVVGTLSPGGAANTYNLKVSSVIYISNTCPKK